MTGTSVTDRVLEVGYGLIDKVSLGRAYEDHKAERHCKGSIPDFLLRPAIRALCRQRLREINAGSFEANHEAKMKWIEGVRARTQIADLTEKANEQHYEVRYTVATCITIHQPSVSCQVSTKFMLSCLGPCAKYSCCLYPTGKETLAEAEVLMLESYCEKAQLRDGLDVLDLGCGTSLSSMFPVFS